MKILIASITDSGILRLRSELIKEMLSNKYQVVVVAPGQSDYKKLTDLGCNFVDIQIKGHGTNPFTDFSVYRNFKKILKAESPDCALLYTTKPNIYCGYACRKLKIPVIMNITGMGVALGKKGLLQRLMILMYRKACNGTNLKCIFFQNDSSRQFFKNEKIGDETKYKLIPGSGVNLSQFSVQPFPKSNTIDFLFVARVLKEKGIEEYIEAARQIRENHPETVFHVLGGCDNDYLQLLKDETQKGTIIYHGRVNNVIDYEKISQCTIHPSYYPEGISNVILEAAASGRPVITTDYPGCREGVDNNSTGYIIPVRNVDALVNAIAVFLSLPLDARINMGILGRKKMEREFNREIIVNEYMKMIRE